MPLAAGAQEAPPPDSAVAPLAPVVVTVLRNPFALATVPYAVSVNVIERSDAAKRGLALDDALSGLPGVQVDNRFNWALGERIAIRGFGARAQFGVRGIKVLVDGIPATLPDGQTTLGHVNLGSLGRAEVIRGPASALWGNAAGGVIQLETAEPPPVPLRQTVRASGGSHGMLRLESSTAGRGDGLVYGVHVTRLTYDGFRDFARAEQLGANARLRLERERDALQLVLNAVTYDARNPGSLTDSARRADPTAAFARNVVQRTGEDGEQLQAGLTWRHRRDAGELRLSAYGLARRIDNPIPTTIIDLERRAGGARAAWASEAALGSAPVRWQLGIETDAQRDDRRNFANESGERGTLQLDQEERVTTVGAFTQGQIELGEWLAVLAGVRGDWFHFRAVDRYITAENPDDSGEREMEAVSGSLGATYRLTPLTSLYANVATAFTTPTTTELANRPSGAGGFNPDLEPQRAVSAEIGARGALGGRATYEIAAYHVRVRDELIAFEVATAPGRQFFRNAGASRHQGIEVVLAAVLARALTATLTYTYTDAEFTDYTDAAGIDYAGERIPGIAPHRANAALAFTVPAGFVAVEARYASRMPVNDANTAWTRATVLLDARAGLDERRVGAVLLSPYVGVTNVFDRAYDASVIVNAFGGRYYEPGPGRAVYVGVALGVGHVGR